MTIHHIVLLIFVTAKEGKTYYFDSNGTEGMHRKDRLSCQVLLFKRSRNKNKTLDQEKAVVIISGPSSFRTKRTTLSLPLSKNE